MKLERFRALLLLTFLAVSACTTQAAPPAPAAAPPTLAGRWTLIEMDGTVPPPGCNVPTIRFDGRRLSSFGGCNTYTGTIEERGDGEITVSPLAGTRRACKPMAMNLDQEYVTRLEKVRRYAFPGGRLTLSGEARGAAFVMVFERRVEEETL